MEYLPEDPNETDIKNKEKTEKRLKEFREYIVDKGIVLSFVKVLLSLKYADQKPKNPIKAIREFFGKYKDPRWDEMGALKEKIILYNNENAKLIEQALKLEDELKTLTRTKKIDQLYNSIELDKNGLIGSKYLIEKLSGNKKFDVDEKFEKDGLIKLIETIVEPHSDEENELIEKMTESLTGENPVYKEDLENPLYLKIVQYFKDLKEANKEAQKKKK
jgi:hypothetical protein